MSSRLPATRSRPAAGRYDQVTRAGRGMRGRRAQLAPTVAIWRPDGADRQEAPRGTEQLAMAPPSLGGRDLAVHEQCQLQRGPRRAHARARAERPPEQLPAAAGRPDWCWRSHFGPPWWPLLLLLTSPRAFASSLTMFRTPWTCSSGAPRARARARGAGAHGGIIV